MSPPPPDGGVLVLAATPIGDPRDAAPRLAEELAGADVVAAEDTRRLTRLCAALGITPAGEVLSYHEHNEHRRTAELAARLGQGARVVVVSDAGMPAVSDPGYRLVDAAIGLGVRVTCVPGPSAVLMALAVSGLPVDRFCFEGFVPRKAGERRRALEALREEPRTTVYFEAPHRLAATLEAMTEIVGADRRGAVCRELTKTYEEVRRGPLAELLAWARGEVRGEITLVVAGAAPARADPTDEHVALAEVRALHDSGMRLRDACREVAARTGVSSRHLYDAAVTGRPPDPISGRRSGHGGAARS